MLTINDIKNANLTKTMMGGYKIEEVDDLLDRICQTLELNEKQKGELTKKLKILGDRVEQYRNDEQTIKNALYDVQKRKIAVEEEAANNARRIMETTERKTEEVKARLQKEIQNALNEAKEIKAKAQLEAKEIKTKAQYEANELMRDCEIQRKGVLAEIEHSKREYIELQNKIVQFRNELIDKYKEHLKIITELPSSDTVKETARQLDEIYPTDGVTDYESKVQHNNQYQEVEKDFDRIIQKTLEFDVDEVKKAIYGTENNTEQENDYHISDENINSYDNYENREESFNNTDDINDNIEKDNSESADYGDKNINFDDKQRVKVIRSDKRSRINYTSRTVTPPAIQSETDDSSGVRIVDVEKDEPQNERHTRTSRFFS